VEADEQLLSGADLDVEQVACVRELPRLGIVGEEVFTALSCVRGGVAARWLAGVRSMSSVRPGVITPFLCKAPTKGLAGEPNRGLSLSPL
jgi:hypothetical protein